MFERGLIHNSGSHSGTEETADAWIYVFQKRSPTTAAAPEYSKYGKMDIRGGRALHGLDVEEFWLQLS